MSSGGDVRLRRMVAEGFAEEMDRVIEVLTGSAFRA